MPQPSGILVDHDTNDQLLHSPRGGSKSERVQSSSARKQKNPCTKVNSPCIRAKEHERLSVAVTCVQSVCSSGPGESSGDHTANDGAFETYSM